MGNTYCRTLHIHIQLKWFIIWDNSNENKTEIITSRDVRQREREQTEKISNEEESESNEDGGTENNEREKERESERVDNKRKMETPRQIVQCFHYSRHIK